ncbi:hypothetical protein VTK73DRAFT_7090 [Phialemonium thermophilum]|uniref:Uncharacterized protein n=1 Tax=Phialemonium thermophilum TaxID=223376 RepID=A0ABR3XUE4_9PEZI
MRNQLKTNKGLLRRWNQYTRRIVQERLPVSLDRLQTTEDSFGFESHQYSLSSRTREYQPDLNLLYTWLSDVN